MIPSDTIFQFFDKLQGEVDWESQTTDGREREPAGVLGHAARQQLLNVAEPWLRLVDKKIDYILDGQCVYLPQLITKDRPAHTKIYLESAVSETPYPCTFCGEGTSPDFQVWAHGGFRLSCPHKASIVLAEEVRTMGREAARRKLIYKWNVANRPTVPLWLVQNEIKQSIRDLITKQEGNEKVHLLVDRINGCAEKVRVGFEQLELRRNKAKQICGDVAPCCECGRQPVMEWIKLGVVMRCCSFGFGDADPQSIKIRWNERMKEMNSPVFIRSDQGPGLEQQLEGQRTNVAHN